MRWWLAVGVGAIVAMTAFVVAEVLTVRSEQAFRERAQELAAGAAVTAAGDIVDGAPKATLRQAVAEATRRRRIAIFLFDGEGRLVSPASSNGVGLESVQGLPHLVRAPLEGQRLVETQLEGPADRGRPAAESRAGTRVGRGRVTAGSRRGW